MVLYFSGISLLTLTAVQSYHGYILFTWLYGICLGGFSYSLKMLTLEHIRARHFTKAWSFVEGAKSIPLLIGIPITGYINQSYPKYGYYFSFIFTIVGANLMFLVGTKKTQNTEEASVVLKTSNQNLSKCNFEPTSDCVCPLMQYNIYLSDEPSLNYYNCNTNHHYERILTKYKNFENFYVRQPWQESDHYHLPKSLSYVANIGYKAHPRRYSVHQNDEHLRYDIAAKNILRRSKSIPLELARRDRYGSNRRLAVKDVQVIEQITTSV